MPTREYTILRIRLSQNPAVRLAISFCAALSAALCPAQMPDRIDGPLSMALAMDISSKNSPAVIGAAADLAAAREAARGARARRSLSASANVFATSGSYGSIFPSAPRVDPGYNLLTPSGSLLDANLMLMYPLLTGGSLEAMAGSAGSLEVAAGFDVMETQADASLAAQDAYLRALLASENASAERDRVEAGEELVRLTKAQLEAGKGIEASVRRAEADLAQGQRALATASGEREKSLLDLKAALGVDLDSNVVLTDPMTDPGAAAPLDEYLLEAESRRASLAASKARLRAAESDVRSAEGARRPQLYGVAMADAASRKAAGGASVGLVLSFPLLDGGGRRAETAGLRAVRDRVRAAVRQTQLSVQREVRQAYIDRATAEANVRSAALSVEAARAAAETTALRVANGKGILVELLDARQASARASADLAQARYDRAISDARLRRASGLPMLPGGGPK